MGNLGLEENRGPIWEIPATRFGIPKGTRTMKPSQSTWLLQLISICCIITHPAMAASTSSAGTGLGLVGQIGGPLHAVAVHNNHAFIGEGMRMIILDISDPANPREIGNTAALDSFVMGISIAGKYRFCVRVRRGTSYFRHQRSNHSTITLGLRFPRIRGELCRIRKHSLPCRRLEWNRHP